MTRQKRLSEAVFSAVIPRQLESGVLYVSMERSTAIHLCMCGCGAEVVTPFGRGSWRICFDGDTVSLTPSVGNGALPCRTHYFIRENRIEWLRREISRPDRQTTMRAQQLFPLRPQWLSRIARLFGVGESAKD